MGKSRSVSLHRLLAKTHNHHITSTCLVLPKPLFSRRRHMKALKLRFETLKHDMGRLDFEIFICETGKFGLSKAEWRRVREPIEDDWYERMEWLDLTFQNNIDWLQPRDNSRQEKNDRTEYRLEIDKILKLEQDARQAGLQLPSSFIRLFENQALLDRMPPNVATSFHIGDGLVKVPGVLDKGAGGYILPFFIDPDWENRFLLYLTNDGAHCILSADEPVLGDTGVELAGLGFEEWLAMMVFEQEIHDAILADWVVGEAVKDYIRAMYVRRPEEMGKPTRMEKRMVMVHGGKVVGPAFPN